MSWYMAKPLEAPQPANQELTRLLVLVVVVAPPNTAGVVLGLKMRHRDGGLPCAVASALANLHYKAAAEQQQKNSRPLNTHAVCTEQMHHLC